MEDKRYPELDEEQGIGMCCEPVAEVAAPASGSVDGITEVFYVTRRNYIEAVI